MADREFPVLVGVFGDRVRAERAATELRAEGYGDDQLGVVWPGAGGPCGIGGLGAVAGEGVAPHLALLGVGGDASAYYQREVAAGRCLLLVGGASGPGHARTAIGRNCGSFRLPEEARAA
ncbi:hypothetical protein [Gemmata sp.]|uniref:hypothetical protein n=1 Tax=Gemmata sp. TaxID=1914242 RepID=UPI003F707C50